jgi:transcriptional regulator with XRE-family HTH domain
MPTLPNPQSIAGDNPAQYGAIMADLHGGRLSYRQVAARHGVGASTVAGIAHRERISRPSAQQVIAAALRHGYDRAERVRLLDLAFERVELLLDNVDDARALQQVVAALATLVDRRRLEEDEPTARTELIDRERARVSLAAKLERLATHRADR